MSAEHKTELVGTHSRLGVSPGGEVSSGLGARSDNFNPGGHCPIRHIVFRRIRRAKALKAADNPRVPGLVLQPYERALAAPRSPRKCPSGDRGAGAARDTRYRRPVAASRSSALAPLVIVVRGGCATRRTGE